MSNYPRISALGLTIHFKPVAHVKRDDLNRALGDNRTKFDKLFGVRTQPMEGLFALYVELILEQMGLGK